MAKQAVSADSGAQKSLASDLWIFGYGSLIWRPDFDYVEKQDAVLSGWSRRFWQGSHDHRGTADSPGRVVTLVSSSNDNCEGVAFRLAPSNRDDILQTLDYREKNGYDRMYATLQLRDGRQVDSLTYIASVDNIAWLGPATLQDMARQIATSHGPSGYNRDYLLELADAFRRLDIDDKHVFELEHAVRALG